MANFSKDLTGQNTAIIRDMFVDADTYVSGEFLKAGLSDGEELGMLMSVDLDDPTDDNNYCKGFAGLCNEPVTTDGDIDSYDLDVAKVIINPFGCWLAEYDQSAGISATASTPTFANTSGKGHPMMGACWLYRMVDPGAGELNLVEDSSTTTTTTTVTLADTVTTAFTTASDFIIIARQGQYGLRLTATAIDADDIDAGYQTAGGQYGYAATILDNYITTDSYRLRPLRMAYELSKSRKTHNSVGLTGLDTLYNGADALFHGLINLTRGSMWAATAEPVDPN